jgi:hypothetical protein
VCMYYCSTCCIAIETFFCDCGADPFKLFWFCAVSLQCVWYSSQKGRTEISCC